mgnify:CR=1 FL=1
MASNRKLTKNLYHNILYDLADGCGSQNTANRHNVSKATVYRVSISDNYEDYFKKQNEQRRRENKNKTISVKPPRNLEIRTSKKDIADAIMVLVDEGYLKLEVNGG